MSVRTPRKRAVIDHDHGQTLRPFGLTGQGFLQRPGDPNNGALSYIDERACSFLSSKLKAPPWLSSWSKVDMASEMWACNTGPSLSPGWPL